MAAVGRLRGVARAAPAGRPPGRRTRLFIAGALAIVTGAGCARPVGSEESAGLRVVGEFESPGEGYLWAPVDVEVDGEEVWVLDAGAGQAYAYDPRGRYRRTIGRKGRGPGELEDPLALGVVGDTLWILNTGNARLEYFSRGGRPLGSEPLPDTLPTPVDLVRWKGAFIGALPFGRLPLVRFGGTAPPVGFGAELARRARELTAPLGEIPSVYRLGVVAGELWVAHLYLPLVAVYEAPGRPGRLLEFAAPDVGRSETGYEEEADRRRWVAKAPPRPAGGLGFLEIGGKTYLLTHRRGEDGRQVLVWWPERGAPGRIVAGPAGLLLVGSARAGERGYVVGARGETEEPVALIVEPGARPEPDATR